MAGLDFCDSSATWLSIKAGHQLWPPITYFMVFSPNMEVWFKEGPSKETHQNLLGITGLKLLSLRTSPYAINLRHNQALEPGLPWQISQSGILLQCRRPGFDPWVGKIPRRRKWQSTPVFLPGKFTGQRSLAGYSSWGRKSWT